MPPPGDPPKRHSLIGTPPRSRLPSVPRFDEDEVSTGSGLDPTGAAVVQAVTAGVNRIVDVVAVHGQIGDLRASQKDFEHKVTIELLQQGAKQERFDERLKKLEKDVDDTGQHSRKAVQDELDRMRGGQVYWVRYVIGAFAGAVLALVLAVLTQRLK